MTGRTTRHNLMQSSSTLPNLLIKSDIDAFKVLSELTSLTETLTSPVRAGIGGRMPHLGGGHRAYST